MSDPHSPQCPPTLYTQAHACAFSLRSLPLRPLPLDVASPLPSAPACPHAHAAPLACPCPPDRAEEMVRQPSGQAAVVLEILLVFFMAGQAADEVKQMVHFKQEYFDR